MTVMFATALLAALLLSPASAKFGLPANHCKAFGLAVGTGTTKDEAMDNMKGIPFKLRENCDEGYACPLTTGMQCGIKFNGCKKIIFTYFCTKICLTPKPVKCKPIGGMGDPHLFGFDGSQFDFHGRPNAHFMLFGRQEGDKLVCGMRAYQHKVFKLGLGREVEGTLFNEFGLQVGGSGERAHVFMARPEGSDDTWVLRAEVDGCHVRDEVSTKEVSVKFLNHKKVQVDTRDHWYTFVLVRGDEDVEAHLNLEVGLHRQPSLSDRFVGVLGATLNRRLGHKVNGAMQPSARDIDRQDAFTSTFEVTALFPEQKPSVDMTGIVARFLVKETARQDKISTGGSMSYEQ